VVSSVEFCLRGILDAGPDAGRGQGQAGKLGTHVQIGLQHVRTLLQRQHEGCFGVLRTQARGTAIGNRLKAPHWSGCSRLEL